MLWNLQILEKPCHSCESRNPEVCSQTGIWIPPGLDPGSREDDIYTRILILLKIYLELRLMSKKCGKPEYQQLCWHHDMNYIPFGRKNRLGKRNTVSRELIRILNECCVIEIPEDEINKSDRGQRRRNRNSAILVLPKRHVGLGMYQLLVGVVPNVIIKTYWERNDVLGYYVRVNLVIEIDVRVVLELFKVGGWKKCKPVVLQRFVREFVHHLNQGTVKHLHVVNPLLNKKLVNLIIDAIL